MPTNVRNTSPLAEVMVAQLKVLAERIGAGANFHLDATANPITAADASDLATSLVLANQIKPIYEDHVKNIAGHKASLPITTLVRATTLATANTLANAIKAAYNTHRASTTYHYNADSTNAVSSADATDQSSLNTLLNEIKTDFNAHSSNGVTGALARLVEA